MADTTDAEIELKLTPEQQIQFKMATGSGISELEFSRLDVAKYLLLALASGIDSLPVARSPQTRKQMVLHAKNGPQPDAPFIFTLQMTAAQQEQIRQVTGKIISSVMVAPDEIPVGYEENWNSDKESLRIGRSLVIVDSENFDFQPAQGDRVIRLTQESATQKVFGTGHHSATRLSLLLLEKYVLPNDRVFDLGTGSGILAVAAVRLGAAEVLAVDIEESAVTATHATIAANGLQENIQAQLASIEAAQGRYDLIVANTFPGVLISLAPQLADAVRSGGTLIFSGVVDARLMNVVDALCAHGFEMTEKISDRGWNAAALKRA